MDDVRLRPRMNRLSVADYTATLTDFDIVISAADFNTGQTDNADFDPGYPEGILAVLECRSSPGAGQYATRTFTSSAVAVIPDISITAINAKEVGSGMLYFDIHLVDRVGTTFPSADTIYIEAQVDL